jgi:hypothetical protein
MKLNYLISKKRVSNSIAITYPLFYVPIKKHLQFRLVYICIHATVPETGCTSHSFRQ